MSNQYARSRPLTERFWEKVDLGGPPPSRPWAPITTGCWLWEGHVGSDGYGSAFNVTGQHDRAVPHRIAYELLVGLIPEGLQLDHLCRVRNCVNPDHLEPVTAKENRVRGGATITHCPSGHEYDGDNTYMRPQGGKACRACARDRTAARRAAARSTP